MPLDNTFSNLRTYIEGKLLNGRTIEDDENLLLSGLIDSLGVMSLVAFMETEFEIEIPFDDVIIENFASLSAMSTYVLERRAVA